MNDDANKQQANAPAPPPVAPIAPNLPQDSSNATVNANKSYREPVSTTPSSSSGGSPLKLVIPIALLVAVVFGVTFISQYSPKSVDDDTEAGLRGQSGVGRAEPPLRFNSSIRQWGPESLQDLIFPGFYEGGETLNSASFWFENRNAAPVTMQLASVSCTKCSGGRLAAIPPDVTDQLVLTAVLSGFPQGLMSGLPLAFAGSSTNLAPNRLNWQEYTHAVNPHPEYKVPAAPGSGHLFPYQWGVFELQFLVAGPGPPKPLTADYVLQVDGTKITGSAKLAINFEGVDPFNVSTNFINVGDWTENSEPRSFSFFVYSSTRGPHLFGPSNRGDLVSPTVDIRKSVGNGDPGPFVTVSPAVRVPESELWQVGQEVEKLQKKIVRIESAYRYTVTVKPKVGEDRVDIGLLLRDIYLAIPDMKEPKQVRIKGMVRGAVWLDNDRTSIDLPSYRYSQGISQTIRLITEQRDVDVVLIANECSPSFAKYELKKLPSAPDRGYYELTVTIPKESKTGTWDGTIVLEIKGARPQRISIPIKGAGKF